VRCQAKTSRFIKESFLYSLIITVFHVVISWGKISTWVNENYDVIASEILRQQEANQASRHFAKTLSYSATSTKHDFERRR
jgi:hypothetical protein